MLSSGSTASDVSSSGAPVSSGGCSSPTSAAAPWGAAGRLAGSVSHPRTTGISEPEAVTTGVTAQYPVCPSRCRPEMKTVPAGSQVPSTVDRPAQPVAGVRRVRAEHGVQRHRRHAA